MNSITIKLKLMTCVFFSVLLTQTGCSSVPSSGESSTENNLPQTTESQSPSIAVIDEQALALKKYENHLEEWQEVKDSIQRLVVIEAELTEVISYLNNLAKQNEQSKTTSEKQTSLVTPAKVTGPLESNSYSLQLAAVTQQSQIKTSWLALTRKHPKILMSLEPTFQEAIVNNKTYYRIKAGRFTNKIEAKELCKQLSALATSCIVSQYNGHTF